MRIAFDAKRAFNNTSGLGNYSRYTISSLCLSYPEHDYLLYTPSINKGIDFQSPENSEIALPESFFAKQFSSYWRSVGLKTRLKKDKIDLYHGLSNELPLGIAESGIKSVVTIHDLIFMRLPELYKSFDRKVYLKKTKNAVLEADQIIAISQQTKDDMIELLGADEKKISIIFQGCHPWFKNTFNEEELRLTREKYQLPQLYILYVGTIEKRKNLLKIIQALHQGKIDIPLVAVGRETDYMNEINQYIRENNIKNVNFIHYIPNSDLPAVYQMAHAFIYPSAYEGFGIPVIEALSSGIPVLTSRGGCLEETAGPGGIFVDPEDSEEMIDSIKRIIEDQVFRDKLILEGGKHVLQFSPEKTIPQLFEVYKKCFE
jgi:glycosyltransferase involved in cell wall biosynthesis